jgi:hypothetical protein
MANILDNARRLARQLEKSYGFDKDLAEQASRVLEELVQNLEAEQAKLKAAEFALNYYREPHLYAGEGCSLAEPILDGGLRARTALSVMGRVGGRALPRRLPLPDFD